MKNITLILAVLLLASCTVVKVPVPVGGSRADGTITLSYEYGSFEKPEVDWNQAQRTAAMRCTAWGYNSAEAFGGILSTCTYQDVNGCHRMRVTAEYQCTGIIR